LARARIRQALGDAVGAHRDREQALRQKPADEEGWIARGVARVTTDTKGALADFAEAVNLNPRSLAGWQNQAHVLAERLGRTREAIAALDRILALHPEHVQARASRGVLRARLGQRTEALSDARAALRLAVSSPEVQFQVAGIYALCSKIERDDRKEALTLLARSLKGGFGHHLIEHDTDLAALREDARFRALVRAARTVTNEATAKR
jgi:tetratricopeptide (TPR) repeat protein